VARGRFPLGNGFLPFTAPQYDLLSTATPINPPNDRWKMGITWEPLCPEADGTYDPCAALVDNAEDPGEAAPAPAPPEKSATTAWQIRGATPFTAYSRIDCSPVGQWEQLSAVNQQALIRSESRFVETAFWSGVAGGQTVVFPHLAADSEVSDGEDLLQPAATVVTDTPQLFEIGLGMLEDAMRDCYPGVATIHLPIRLASIAADHDLIAPRGAVMHTTSIGSKVVIGDYPGTAPDGTSTEGVTWVYATGEVFFARDQQPKIFTAAESFDRNVNTLEMLAERTYVIGWDCCLLAIPIVNGEL
jgi:hypothetical protein